MFDLGSGATGSTSATVGGVVALPSAEEIRAMTVQIATGAATDDVSDPQRVDQIRAFEELKCAVGGAQAALTVRFDASQRREQAVQGVRGDRQVRGVALQVGLARRESHHVAKRLVRLADVLHTDLLHTLAAMRAGKLSERRAQLIATELACLSPENRQRADVCLAEDTEWLAAQGDKQLIAEARRLAYRLEPSAYLDRFSRAESNRRVTTRPAPEGMLYLTALLPLVQGVACYAALKTHADSLIAGGDPRSRDQIIADTLVERVTGQGRADQVPIEVGIVLSDRTAVGMDDEPATVRTCGPIPADMARYLVLTANMQGLATLRRLYAHPSTGQITGRESIARKFPAGLADLIRIRDGDNCRMAYCGAPIRDTDHAKAKLEGGEASYGNGQGLCEACNIAKEAMGMQARPRPGPDGQHATSHIVDTTTPTGHVYTSVAPRVRYVHRPRPVVEIYLAEDYRAS